MRDDIEPEWRRENIGRIMNAALARFERRVFNLLADAGHGEVPLAHLHLTRNLDHAGATTTVLARRAAMTKQAMSEIIAQSEAAGLVHRSPDPADARAKIVRFTDAGLAWLAAFRLALEQAEREMAADLGLADMHALRGVLARYAAGS